MDDLLPSSPTQSRSRSKETKIACAPTRPFKLEASNIGNSTDHGDFDIDFFIGTFCFRAESDIHAKLSANRF